MVLFREIKVTGKKAPWCVDGRKAVGASKGPQMLGGSLHPLVLAAVYFGKGFDNNHIASEIQTLKQAGFGIGVHRGSHKDGQRSDCGFSDNLPKILAKTVAEQAEITERIKAVYKANSQVLGEMPEEVFARVLTMIGNYSLDNIKISGEELIASIVGLGAQVINLEGDHSEQTAFVNLKKGVTFDTNTSDEAGEQAFNLDLWSSLEQAEALGVDKGFATSASLILYQATEMVLVEDKSKERLPVILHS